MLGPEERVLLDLWCRQRAMRWYPAPGRGASALMLAHDRWDRPFARMLLVREADEFLLHEANGSILAMASDLPALLDAVDAGVADESVVA
jgi:hypothetical protein